MVFKNLRSPFTGLPQKLTLLCCLAGLMSGSSLVGKTLKFAYDADPVSLDPYEQLSGGTLQLSHLTFDPLVRWSKDMKIVPRLAESWKKIDDKTTRFKLRQGVLFHSGRTLSSDDVVWTFNRVRKYSGDFKLIFEPIESIKKVSDLEFDVVATKNQALLLNVLTYMFPMDRVFYQGTDKNGKPKDQVVKHGDAFATTNASGTGPFIVTKRQQGIRVEFKRFDKYWNKTDTGNVQEMVLTPIKEGATRVAALLAGDIDMISPVPPNDMKRIKSNGKTKLVTEMGTRIIMLQMNQNRRPEFKNKKVREAINLAINNAGIAKKVMRNFATPAGQMSPPGYSGHNPALQPRYDLPRAKQLMKEAGYEKGFSISMMAPNNRYVNDARIAKAVAAMLAKINIKVDLKTLPKAQYWPEFDKRAADIMMLGWHSDTEDSANFHEYLTMTEDKKKGTGQYNLGGFSNGKLDQMVQTAALEADSSKRQKILQDLEQLVYDEALIIPLHWQNLAWGARKGVKIEPIVNALNFPYLGDLVIQ